MTRKALIFSSAFLVASLTLIPTRFRAAFAATPDEPFCPQELPRLRCSMMPFALDRHETIEVRVGVMAPVLKRNEQPKGDVLYLHGFGDRLDNHGPLFSKLNAAGLRVIAFDLPGHGEDRGNADSIDAWPFEKLAELAVAVDQYGRGSTDAEREAAKSIPLILAGWSTGGLIVTRMIQSSEFPKPDRPVAGAILYAPGISVFKLPGDLGHVTPETLSSVPAAQLPHYGEISPAWPVLHVMFGTRMLVNAALAQTELMPPTPTLVFSGGDQSDLYAKSWVLRSWVKTNNSQGARLYGVTCPGSKHEMDNEAPGIGDAVRLISARFATALLKDDVAKPDYSAGSCTEYSRPEN